MVRLVFSCLQKKRYGRNEGIKVQPLAEGQEARGVWAAAPRRRGTAGGKPELSEGMNVGRAVSGHHLLLRSHLLLLCAARHFMVMNLSAAHGQRDLKGRLNLGSAGWCCVLPELFSGVPNLLFVALTVQNCS